MKLAEQNVQLFAVTGTGHRKLPVSDKATDIHDLYDNLPIGVYTAMRTFEHRKFLCLEEHLNRLDQSMAMLGWDFQLNRMETRRALDQVCTSYQWPDARVRIDVLAKPASHVDSESRVLIALSPFRPVPMSVYHHGVSVDVTPELVRHEPLVKQARFVLERRQFFQGEPSAFECLLLDSDGLILEGTTSNFYAIRDGALWTVGGGVLEGIARRIVLKVAQDVGLPVKFEGIKFSEVAGLEEAAISSSSRGIIPVVKIGGTTVGDGRPGPLVQRLSASYASYVKGAIRPAI